MSILNFAELPTINLHEGYAENPGLGGTYVKHGEHQEKAHAKLSASGSSRWLNCPGSVSAEEGYKNESSIFAEEGTLAHELADACLKGGKDADFYIGKEILGKIIDKDMARYVQEYVDFVLSHETANSNLYTEERVDFSNVVPGGFGTMDSAVLDYESGVCHIFDLKYGKGIEVDAFENTQGQMYAIGLYNELGFLDEIKSFRIHIVQPRIYNFSHWDIAVQDLTKFGRWVKERAKLALTADAPRVPGDKQCQWCKAKGECKSLADFSEQIILTEFDNIDDKSLTEDALSDDQKKAILDNKKLIESFLKAVESSVFDTLDAGGTFIGYKLVEGRSIRKWNDNAEKVLVEELGESAYKKSLLGITDAQKKLGKDLVDSIAFKPAGKTTLVPEADKRTAIVKGKIDDEFDKLT